ncbi:hypothetical protein TWF281_011023 [Arthrobotrys megalospora]
MNSPPRYKVEGLGTSTQYISPILRVPNEILMTIFDNLSQSEILTMTLVCQAFYVIALRYRYRCLTINMCYQKENPLVLEPPLPGIDFLDSRESDLDTSEITLELLQGNETVKELAVEFNKGFFQIADSVRTLKAVRNLESLSFNVLWSEDEGDPYLVRHDISFYNAIWDFVSLNTATLQSLHFCLQFTSDEDFDYLLENRLLPFSSRRWQPLLKLKELKLSFFPFLTEAINTSPFFVPEALSTLSLTYIDGFDEAFLNLLVTGRLANLTALQIISSVSNETISPILQSLPPLKILHVSSDYKFFDFYYLDIEHLRGSMEVLWCDAIILTPDSSDYSVEDHTDYSGWPNLRELALSMDADELKKLKPPPKLHRFRLLKDLTPCSHLQDHYVSIFDDIVNRQIQYDRDKVQKSVQKIPSLGSNLCRAKPSFEFLIIGENDQAWDKEFDRPDIYQLDSISPEQAGICKTSIQQVPIEEFWSLCEDTCLLGEQRGPWAWIGRPYRNGWNIGDNLCK